MGERWEYGQWVVDADGEAFQRCERSDCEHPSVRPGTWWDRMMQSHVEETYPARPLTPLFTAEQVAQQVAQARAEALREAAQIVADCAAQGLGLMSFAAAVEAAAVAGRDTAEGGTDG